MEKVVQALIKDDFIIKFLNEEIDDVDHYERTGLHRKIIRGSQGGVFSFKHKDVRYDLYIMYNKEHQLYYPYLPEYEKYFDKQENEGELKMIEIK